MVKINYMQVQDMTDEELFKIYMKLPKKEIVKMLIECNKILKAIKPCAMPIDPEIREAPVTFLQTTGKIKPIRKRFP